MENIILFRFHSDFEICKERIKILKHFNPNLPILGLYGGPKENFEEAKKILGNSLINIQISSSENRNYKWFHADQTLKEWFQNYGKDINFKFLFDYESDIFTLAPLKTLYPEISDSTIALSALEEFEKVESIWNWTSESPHKEAFNKLCEFMETTYKVKKPKYASLGPGPYFSKKFLSDFSNSEQPKELIDPVVSEIIYPFYAEALGYKMVNTNLHPGWFDEQKAAKYFNCENIKIEKETIIEEGKSPRGRRAFHPVKYMVTLKEAKSMLG